MTPPLETGDIFPHARVTNRSRERNKRRGRYLRSDRAFESAVITGVRHQSDELERLTDSAQFSLRLSRTNLSGVMDKRCVICPENLVPSGQGEERDGEMAMAASE